jgi:hypothetical protein
MLFASWRNSDNGQHSSSTSDYEAAALLSDGKTSCWYRASWHNSDSSMNLVGT